MLPIARCHAITTCAGVAPLAAAIDVISASSSSGYLPCPSGPHASIAMPCRRAAAPTGGCWWYGWNSIWSTAGTVSDSAITRSR